MHIYLDDTFAPSIVVNAERLWRGSLHCYFSTYATAAIELGSGSRPSNSKIGVGVGEVYQVPENPKRICNDPGTNLITTRIRDYADFLDIYLDYAINHKTGFLFLGSQGCEPIPRLISAYLEGWEALASAVTSGGDFKTNSAAYAAWAEHLHRCEAELGKHFHRVIAFGKEGRLLILGPTDVV